MLGNTGFAFQTSLQILVMQHAKCSVFTGAKEEWDRWSMEWKAYLQVMKGVVGGEEVMVLTSLLKMHMPESVRARWTARESIARPLTYGQLWDDLEVAYRLNSHRERRTAWNALALTFSGKLIDRAGWEIYIAEFKEACPSH